MPADVIAKGKLSDLQLEAVVYGCMRHLEDMPVGTGQQKAKKGSIEEDYEDDYEEVGWRCLPPTPTRYRL